MDTDEWAAITNADLVSPMLVHYMADVPCSLLADVNAALLVGTANGVDTDARRIGVLIEAVLHTWLPREFEAADAKRAAKKLRKVPCPINAERPRVPSVDACIEWMYPSREPRHFLTDIEDVARGDPYNHMPKRPLREQKRGYAVAHFLKFRTILPDLRYLTLVPVQTRVVRILASLATEPSLGLATLDEMAALR